jgi:signal transduction histidine kinase
MIGSAIILIASFAIYLLSDSYRKASFYETLENKVINTAKLLLEVDEIDGKLLKKILKNNSANLPNEKIIILNKLNEVFFTSDENGEIVLDNNFINKIRRNARSTFRYNNYEILGLKYQIQEEQFVFIAAATDIEGLLKLKNLVLILTIVDMLCLILFFIAGWFNSGRALQPISEVVKKVEEITITSLNLRVPEGNGTDEIARLAKTFNKMLARLEASFSVQKDFIANASHELRTPLTSINGQLDVLMLKERNAEEYKNALVSVKEDIKSLIELANQLLMIARTTAQRTDSFKKVRIDDIIWQAREDILKFNKSSHISINISDSLTEEEQMTVEGDENLLRTAIVNLIDNACKYSGDHSVIIDLDYSGGYIFIRFTDKGIGIPEEELDKVLRPFYRGSNAIQYPGSGIGLQLVNQIIEGHNGEIGFLSELNKGTTVTISLPSVFSPDSIRETI